MRELLYNLDTKIYGLGLAGPGRLPKGWRPEAEKNRWRGSFFVLLILCYAILFNKSRLFQLLRVISFFSVEFLINRYYIILLKMILNYLILFNIIFNNVFYGGSMAYKIALSNMKGGVGKTTSALCLADVLRQLGYRVLLIDTDPQCNATGVYTDDETAAEQGKTLADIMYHDSPAEECIRHFPLGDIIISDSDLSNADTLIDADVDRFYHLQDACRSLEESYDFIICDCPPGNGVLLGNVLSYVDSVIMPITCDRFGVQGMTGFADVMHSYSKRINPNLKILGVLIIKYKGRQSLTRDLEENIIPEYVSEMGTKVFTTKIRESVKCQEAQVLQKSLFSYAPKCTTAMDYSDFAKEMLEDIGYGK